MKKVFIIFILNIIINYFIQTAALIPHSIRTKTSEYANKTAEKILGPTLAHKLNTKTTKGMDWWNWYWKGISQPTIHEAKIHGLWYGFKSGTNKSLYGHDPVHDLYNYYQSSKNQKTKFDNPQQKEALEKFHKAYSRHYFAENEKEQRNFLKEMHNAMNDFLALKHEEKNKFKKPVNLDRAF